MLVARDIDDTQQIARLPEAEQQAIVVAILRREMGVMALAAVVVCFLALRAAGHVVRRVGKENPAPASGCRREDRSRTMRGRSSLTGAGTSSFAPARAFLHVAVPHRFPI